MSFSSTRSMPRMSGIEAALLICKEAPQSEILIVSNHESAQIARLAIEAGAKGYVPKSQISSALVPAIESLEQKTHAKAASASPSSE
jgi:DNA-binding NarL/FixJ family response regulator